MKTDSNWTQPRAIIKAYLIAIKVAKQNYFFALIACTEYCPVALFWIIWPFLDQESWDDHLQVCAEEFAEHMIDKVAWIYSQLEPMSGAGLFEMIGDSLILLDMKGSRQGSSASTCQSPCPSWLVKVDNE